jgi:adenosylhomocysteine nucleosidase
LKQERRSFCREFHPHQRFGGAPCWARFCGPAWLSVLVLETGVGRVRTEQALSWLLGKPLLTNLAYKPKLVLAAGYCGGLEPSLRTGDLVLATDVLDADTGSSWETTWPLQLPDGPWDPPLHRGRLVTVPHLAARPDQKRALAQQFGAVVVDMESAFLARLCYQAEVPFGCLRVVLDEMDTPLSPRLLSILSSGSPSPWRMAAAVLAAPRLAAELWPLAKKANYASARLGKALGEVLTLTLPWLDD